MKNYAYKWIKRSDNELQIFFKMLNFLIFIKLAFMNK